MRQHVCERDCCFSEQQIAAAAPRSFPGCISWTCGSLNIHYAATAQEQLRMSSSAGGHSPPDALFQLCARTGSSCTALAAASQPKSRLSPMFTSTPGRPLALRGPLCITVDVMFPGFYCFSWSEGRQLYIACALTLVRPPVAPRVRHDARCTRAPNRGSSFP